MCSSMFVDGALQTHQAPSSHSPTREIQAHLPSTTVGCPNPLRHPVLNLAFRVRRHCDLVQCRVPARLAKLTVHLVGDPEARLTLQ
jgi:hypothetical protein